jgi:hypothetical protein
MVLTRSSRSSRSTWRLESRRGCETGFKSESVRFLDNEGGELNNEKKRKKGKTYKVAVLRGLEILVVVHLGTLQEEESPQTRLGVQGHRPQPQGLPVQQVGLAQLAC